MARRARHEPVQYLLGEVGVLRPRAGARPRACSSRVPRPRGSSTGRWPSVHRRRRTVLDLCTGSGAVACALAARRPGWTVWAVEQAERAAECARANVRRLGLEGASGCARAISSGRFGVPCRAGAVDLVVANPPYLADAHPADSAHRGSRLGAPGGARRRPGRARSHPPAARPGPRVASLRRVRSSRRSARSRARRRARSSPRTRRYAAVLVHRDFRGCERVLEARRR